MTHDSMQAEVLRAMPAAPAELSALQIHARVGQWSYISIKHALRELAEAGQVVRSGDLENPTYRRAA